jgi:hypothetical protein
MLATSMRHGAMLRPWALHCKPGQAFPSVKVGTPSQELPVRTARDHITGR